MRTATIACVFALSTFGCRGDELKFDLQSIAIAYTSFSLKGRGPADAEDLQSAFKAKSTSLERALQRARSGEIVVRWGLRCPEDFPEGMSQTVLAYEKDVPTRGGSVVMADSTFRVMTPEQFKDSPQPRRLLRAH